MLCWDLSWSMAPLPMAGDAQSQAGDRIYLFSACGCQVLSFFIPSAARASMEPLGALPWPKVPLCASSEMLPFRMNHILHYLAWGAWWRGVGMAVGWRKWMPAVR